MPESHPQGKADRSASASELESASGHDVDQLEAQLREELAPEMEIVKRLGKGSAATVYLAREGELKRFVAVKVLAPDRARDERTRRRFEREAQAVAALSHPAIVAVYRVGRLSNDLPYIVMQYIKGKTLEERLHAEGAMGLEEAQEVLARIASALAAAHEKGIVHRDVRAGNVLHEQGSGRVFLSDFGIAAIQASADSGPSTRLTRAGELIGDPRYMSPEQLSGDDATDLSDVYSFGLLGYEILAGRLPYDASGKRELIRAHLTEEPRRLSELCEMVDPETADLLFRCLAKEPNHRPSAAVIARRLSEVVDGKGAAARAAHAGGLLSRLTERRLPQIVFAYGAIAWGLLELSAQLVERGILPEVAYQLVLVAVATGLPAVLTGAWFHGKKGRQQFEAIEYWVFGGLGLIWAAVSALILVGWLS